MDLVENGSGQFAVGGGLKLGINCKPFGWWSALQFRRHIVSYHS
jgi:hypothetical protein